MPRALEQHVGEIPLLVHDPSKRALAVEPRRRRFPREALYSSEREVLDDDLRTAVRDVRVVVSRVEHERDLPYGCIREERCEKRDRLDGRIPVPVPERGVVSGPERVRNVHRPVLGCRGMERCADGGVVKEDTSVFGRRGFRCVGNIVEVNATVLWRGKCQCMRM